MPTPALAAPNVVAVLRASSEPICPAAVHDAVEVRLGQAMAYSSIKDCLGEALEGHSPRFERVTRARYRLL